MGLFDFFKEIKRVMTGEVIQQIDTPAYDGATTISLRLKREKNSNEYYVVLAGLSGDVSALPLSSPTAKSSESRMANATEAATAGALVLHRRCGGLDLAS